jgi:hypothetical protein
MKAHIQRNFGEWGDWEWEEFSLDPQHWRTQHFSEILRSAIVQLS